MSQSSQPVTARTPADVFRQLVTGVCERRWDDLPDLYAERTRVSHPFAPGHPPALLSRAEIAEHFQARPARPGNGELRFEPHISVIHETADPEVIVAEFEYRGAVPGTGEVFSVPGIFVMRVRDGEIVESRDYHDHAEMARVRARSAPAAVQPPAAVPPAAVPSAAVPSATGPADTEPANSDLLGRAKQRYEAALFAGQTGELDIADRELDAAEAGLALARGRNLHARFLAGGVADDAELTLFQRAADGYAALGDGAAEADALFWIGTFHQVVRGDHDSAVPLLRRARELSEAAGDTLTLSYALRHLGFVASYRGDTGLARQLLTESLALRRDLGFDWGVAAALLALAEVSFESGDETAAAEFITEAQQVAAVSGAAGITSRIEQVLAGWPSPPA